MVQLAIWIVAAWICFIASIYVLVIGGTVVMQLLALVGAAIKEIFSSTVENVSAPVPQVSVLHTQQSPRLGRSLVLRLGTLRAKQPIEFPKNPSQSSARG